MTAAGYLTALDVQAKSMSRIVGGHDLIVCAPSGSGKTTSAVLGVLMRIKSAAEEAPRALILVPDTDKVIELLNQFASLNKNQTIRVIGLHAGEAIDEQMNMLADGADIVVATPDKARALYLKLGLNLNKIIMFIVDDAEQIIKKRQQLPVSELARSISRCQHLVFTTAISQDLQHMTDRFMNFPTTIEADRPTNDTPMIRHQSVYCVPDHNAKLKLLNSVLEAEKTGKALIFVKSRLTAQKLYNSLHSGLREKTSILNPLLHDQPGFENIEEFRQSSGIDVMIVADEVNPLLNVTEIQRIIHFEIPEEVENYLQRIIIPVSGEEDLSSIIFSTNSEFNTIEEIERLSGREILHVALPQ